MPVLFSSPQLVVAVDPSHDGLRVQLHIAKPTHVDSAGIVSLELAGEDSQVIARLLGAEFGLIHRGRRAPVTSTMHAGTLFMFCDDGSVWRAGEAVGSGWAEQQPIPGSRRDLDRGGT